MARRQYSFQKGSKGGDKSHSITLKDRGPAVDGDTSRRTTAITIRCDKSSKNKSLCARAKELEREAIALAKDHVTDEESPTKRVKRRKVEPAPF